MNTEATRNQEQEAFKKLWEEVMTWLPDYLHGRFLLRNSSDVEDICQEVAVATWLNFCEKWKHHEEPEYTRRWVVRSAHWRILNRLRIEKRQRKIWVELGARSTTRRDVTTGILDIWDAIDQLPAHQNEVAVKRLGGTPDREIARKLGVDEATVRSHWRHAKLRLSELLGEAPSARAP